MRCRLLSRDTLHRSRMIEPWLISGSAAGAAAVAGLFAYGAWWPRSQMFGRVIWHGSQDGPARVALTFDDGPHPETTPAILQTLARHRVRAAFFVIGANVVRWPSIVRQIHEQGHVLGNHSFHHSSWGMFGHGRYWRAELARTDEVVHAIVGHRPALFRPPMGLRQPHIGRAAKRDRHLTVTWTRRAYDGVPTTSAKIVERLVKGAAAGAILALHDGAPLGRRHIPRDTVLALEPLIIEIQALGIQLARLDELIGRPAYQ
jgi:peptidoglycan-N-acetylglucosamine deacetylase